MHDLNEIDREEQCLWEFDSHIFCHLETELHENNQVVILFQTS